MVMIKRSLSRLASFVRRLESRFAPTSAHRRWVETWARHGAEREWDILDVLVDPRRGALDVGASGGVYTSRLAALVPEVLAIEPNPELCRVLRRAKYPNVQIVEAAVSNRLGTSKLYIPLRKDGVRSLPCATLEPLDQLHPSETIEVRVIRLAEYVNIPIGFVKIDIEGHELAALQGALDVFVKHRPNAVVEIEDDAENERISKVVNFFASIGYQGFFLSGGEIHPIESLTPYMQDRSLLDKKIPRRESPFVNNFIFLPNETAPEFCGQVAARLKQS